MNKPLLLLFSLFFVSAYGQQQKLINFLGADFHPIPARIAVPYMESDPKCEMIASRTFLGDTSGIVYHNEFMLFRNYWNPAQDEVKGAVSFLKSSFVSNAEYQEFQRWVRDSIARERIYGSMKKRMELAKYINVTKKEIETKKVDLWMSERNSAISFNWKTKFSYQDPELKPFFAEMYLPQPERFYKVREFDERKLLYNYIENTKVKGAEELRSQTVTISHEAFWAQGSISINDERSVLGQAYDRLFPAFPVVGLTGMQAKAFCHWKQIQLQQQADLKKLPYQVKVTLPMLSELNTLPSALPIPQQDYTAQWKITVRDYREFMKNIHDSLVMDALYNELYQTNTSASATLLQHPDSYFDEGSLQFLVFDPHNENNRYYFPLITNLKVFRKYPEQVQQIERMYAGKLSYSYDRMDIVEKSLPGKLEVDENMYYHDGYSDNKNLRLAELNPITEEPSGMDMDLNYMNRLRQGTGVRGHENYRRFIIPVTVQIEPEISMEKQGDEDPVKGITYEQALAYYHWKYPVWKAKAGDKWQQFVYPNEAQFKLIQKGEQVIVPAHELGFPSPTFRYVVTFVGRH